MPKVTKKRIDFKKGKKKGIMNFLQKVTVKKRIKGL